MPLDTMEGTQRSTVMDGGILKAFGGIYQFKHFSEYLLHVGVFALAYKVNSHP